MRWVFLSTLLLSACAGPTASAPAPASASIAAPAAAPPASPAVAAPETQAEMRADLDKWKMRPVSHDCRVALTALAADELDQFHGLGPCGRVDAEGTLGDSGDAPSQFDPMGEYRVFTRPGGSVIAWFLADEIRVVELLYPKLHRSLAAELGPPESKLRSKLSPDWDQWVYAARGLTAHVSRKSGEVVALFAYRPTTLEAFLQSDIARVSKSESPLEELK